MPWSTERPGQDVYRQAHQNIGKYTTSSLGKPYINPAVPMYVPNDGENCIRIVDPLELLELQIYYFEVNFHREVGFRKDYFLCNTRHNIGPCAVCENVNEDLWQTDKDAAKALLPDQRRLMWVLDLKKPEEAHILKLWSAPRSLSDEILAQSRNPELDVIQEVSHPYEGVPVYYMRTGKGLTTRYTGVKLGSAPMPVDEAIADQRFKFMDILIIPSYEEVYASFHMQDMPEEANPELPPTSAYDDSSATPPAHEVGAAAAAEAARDAENQTQTIPETLPQGGAAELDYSDLERIQPDHRECFRNELDQWEDCAACVDRGLCEQPWPPKRVPKAKPKAKPAAKAPAKKAAPKRVPPQTPPPRVPPHTGAAPPQRTTPAAGAAAGGGDNAARIRSAQEKLKADIARRKAGG